MDWSLQRGEVQTQLVLHDASPMDVDTEQQPDSQLQDWSPPAFPGKDLLQDRELERRLAKYNHDPQLILQELRSVDAELSRLSRKQTCRIRIDLLDLKDAKRMGYTEAEIAKEDARRRDKANREEMMWWLHFLDMKQKLLASQEHIDPQLPIYLTDILQPGHGFDHQEAKAEHARRLAGEDTVGTASRSLLLEGQRQGSPREAMVSNSPRESRASPRLSQSSRAPEFASGYWQSFPELKGYTTDHLATLGTEQKLEIVYGTRATACSRCRDHRQPCDEAKPTCGLCKADASRECRYSELKLLKHSKPIKRDWPPHSKLGEDVGLWEQRWSTIPNTGYPGLDFDPGRGFREKENEFRLRCDELFDSIRAEDVAPDMSRVFPHGPFYRQWPSHSKKNHEARCQAPMCASGPKASHVCRANNYWAQRWRTIPDEGYPGFPEITSEKLYCTTYPGATDEDGEILRSSYVKEGEAAFRQACENRVMELAGGDSLIAQRGAWASGAGYLALRSGSTVASMDFFLKPDQALQNAPLEHAKYDTRNDERSGAIEDDSIGEQQEENYPAGSRTAGDHVWMSKPVRDDTKTIENSHSAGDAVAADDTGTIGHVKATSDRDAAVAGKGSLFTSRTSSEEELFDNDQEVARISKPWNSSSTGTSGKSLAENKRVRRLRPSLGKHQRTSKPVPSMSAPTNTLLSPFGSPPKNSTPFLSWASMASPFTTVPSSSETPFASSAKVSPVFQGAQSKVRQDEAAKTNDDFMFTFSPGDESTSVAKKPEKSIMSHMREVYDRYQFDIEDISGTQIKTGQMADSSDDEWGL